MTFSEIFPTKALNYVMPFPGYIVKFLGVVQGGMERWEGFYFILPVLLAPKRTSVLIPHQRMKNNNPLESCKMPHSLHPHCVSQWPSIGTNATNHFTWVLHHGPHQFSILIVSLFFTPELRFSKHVLQMTSKIVTVFRCLHWSLPKHSCELNCVEVLTSGNLFGNSVLKDVIS